MLRLRSFPKSFSKLTILLAFGASSESSATLVCKKKLYACRPKSGPEQIQTQRMSAQAKPISQVVKDFEQSPENLRPSTKRVYVAGAKAAIRAASLELWQSPSTNELLASIGKSPTEKRARISPFLGFLGDGRPKQSVSNEDSAALQNFATLRIRDLANFPRARQR